MPKLVLCLLILVTVSALLLVVPVLSGPTPLALVNTCTAENHTGTTNISCSLSVTAGNVIVATGTVSGTNAACSTNPILGINAFNFDFGDLYFNWHGTNKLSTEVYDSGILTTSGSLVVTLSGQCFMNFSSLIVYQFTGVTSVAVPSSINGCNGQVTGATSISCSLTSLNGFGWIVGHVAGDCTGCSYTNQVSQISQPSAINFTDYAGIIKTVTGNASNSFRMTSGPSFSGSVVALSILGNPIPQTASGNLDNAVVTGTSMLIVLTMIAIVSLLLVAVSMIASFFGNGIVLSPLLIFGVGLIITVILGATVLAITGSFDAVFRGQGN